MAEQGDEDEVGVDPAVDFPEPLGLVVGVQELPARAPPLASDDEIVRLLERVAQPGQRLRHRRVLQLQQQVADHGYAAREILALQLVLPGSLRRPGDLRDQPVDVQSQLGHRRQTRQTRRRGRHGRWHQAALYTN